MEGNFNILVFVTLFVQLTWGIYIPEHTMSNINLNGWDCNIPEKQTTLKNLKQNLNDLINKSDDDKGDGQKSVFTARRALTNAQLSPIQTQQKSYDIYDDVVSSEKNRTSNVYKNLEAQPTGLAEQQQHGTHNNDVLVWENDGVHDKRNTLHHSRQRRQLSDFLIAPNTRWCGRGNTANGTYNHLGGASMADKCCRTHDHCKLYIPAMSNRFDLFNYRPYTLSHCNCDRRFRTCLKMANDEDANYIGKLFFNLVQTQCFILHKEVICQQHADDGTCLKQHIKQKAHLRNNKKY